MKTCFVIGGAGCLGSNFVLKLLSSTDHRVINYDKLTYAGNLESLPSVSNNPNHIFEQGDICDRKHALQLINRYQHLWKTQVVRGPSHPCCWPATPDISVRFEGEEFSPDNDADGKGKEGNQSGR